MPSGRTKGPRKLFTIFGFWCIISKVCIQKDWFETEKTTTSKSSFFRGEGVTIAARIVVYECGRRNEWVCVIILPKQ